MIYWLTGQPGAGKTTLVKMLYTHLHPLKPMIVDGDDIREIFNNKDYSEAGRRKNVELAQHLAHFIHNKGGVALVSLVSDFRLTSGCLGVVEDILEIQHLNAYLKNSLITKEVYDKLIGLLVSKVIEDNNEDGGGYIFERGNNEVSGEFLNEIKGSIKEVEGEEKEEEINLDDL